jgi:DNA-binding response OmpR family regulator
MASASSRRNALPSGSAVVLLVESHEDSRDMYADYLRACGFMVQTADTTDDGLLRASDADVIVTEICVHGSFDGVELVGRLREADETKETPIIVLTACAFASDEQRALAAGCDVFLPKPCLPGRLLSEIRGVGATTLKG